MSILDQITRSANEMVDRARFEADKFQRTTRLQAEISELQQQADQKMIELGARAYELYRAGQISSATLGALAQSVDQIRAALTRKEEELSEAQAMIYPTGTAAAPSRARPVPVEDEPAPPPPARATPAASQPTPPAASATKTCPACNFTMAARAIYCPNCGFRVGQ